MHRIWMLLVCGVGSLAVADDNLYRATLAKFEIKDDADGIATYLRSLHPTPDEKRRLEGLINQLGNEDYFSRKSALQQLLKLPTLPLAMLQEATASKDPEVRWRAREVLTRAGNHSATLMYAAFKTIAQKKLLGLAPEVLAAIPLCDQEYMQRVAREALQGTTSERFQDVEVLRTATDSEDHRVRIAAVESLALLLGPAASLELGTFLEDEHDAVRLSAAVAIGRQYTSAARSLPLEGDRRWLGTLGDLLTSDAIQVRVESAQVLRAVTGQQIAFTPYEAPEALYKSANVWRDWIAGPGQAATLFHVTDQPFDMGRLLICYFQQNKVIELNVADLTVDGAEREPLWTQTVTTPWACQGLPNGHRIIASHNARFVVEYDAAGKEVWRKDGLPGSPFSVQRLENGNTLLACSDSQKVVEIDLKGEEVWSHIVPGRPMDARRLANGRTLITLQTANQVIEIDQDKNETWRLESISHPLTSQRLDNGNTLVCETGAGRVTEYSPDKKLVWSKEGLGNPYHAQRLASGNTVISDNIGVREVDMAGEVVWEIAGTSTSRVSRY